MTPRNAPWLLIGALSWCALPVLGHETPAVEVVAAHDLVLGSRDSASQGTLGEAALAQALTVQFGLDEARQLKAMCDDEGIEFMASVFDLERFAWTQALGVRRPGAKRQAQRDQHRQQRTGKRDRAT